MNIENFFPYYPPIDDDDFIQNLYESKEFYDLSLNIKNDKLFKNHQLFPARFLSPWTDLNYNSLLLIHDTGTGKSGAMSSLINITKNYDSKKRVIYISKNEILLNNFKLELQKLCPYIYKKIEQDIKYQENFTGFLRMEKISFYTYNTFAKFIKDSPISSKNFCNNALIILDEVHNIYSSNLTNYHTINNFFNELPKKKLLLATATPMRNNLIESIYLLNLLFKKENEFNIPNFINEYLISTSIDELNEYSTDQLVEYTFKENMEKKFKKKIKGYISIFRQKSDNIDIVNEGAIIKPLRYSHIYPDVFENFQNEIYNIALNKDLIENIQNEGDNDDENNENEYSNFYLNSLQASLMVFPDKTYGTNARKYITKDNSYNKIFDEETGMRKKNSNEENLNILKNYSIIYYNIIKDILDEKNKDKCFYIYSDKINGSGIFRLLFLLSQYFGFDFFKSQYMDFNVKRPRFIYLNETTDNITSNQILQQINIFNDSRNKHGEYIKIVFGTDKTREGISLKNIQNIHIITPSWNFGKINQAKGRGLRLGSHLELDDPQLNIFMHCGISSNQPLSRSVNFLQYIRSENKEINNYLLMYSFLTSSVDCQINYLQNSRPTSDDGSVDCYFRKCKYECDGILNPNPSEIKEGNFNTFYIYDYIKKIILILQKIFFFNEQNSICLEDFMDIFKKEDITLNLLYESLMTIIDTPIVIPNELNIPCFLNFSNNSFYLSYSYNVRSDVYTNKFEDIFNNNFVNSFAIQQNTNSILDSLTNTFFEEKIELLKNTDLNKNLYLDTFPNNMKSIILTKFQPDSHEIFDANQSQEQMQQKNMIENKKFYGIITKDSDSFKIRDVSTQQKKGTTKRKTTGKDCKSVPVAEIIFYIIELLQPFQENVIEEIKSLVRNSMKNDSKLLSYEKFTDNNFLNEFNLDEKNIKDSFLNFTKDFYSEYELTPIKYKIIVYLSILSKKRNFLCGFLRNLMQQHKLLINV